MQTLKAELIDFHDIKEEYIKYGQDSKIAAKT